MSKAEATAITQRIRDGFDRLGTLLQQAQDRKAWKALGYENWESYWKQEFGYTRQRYYQLVDQGKVAKKLAAATGDLTTAVDISERAARDIKPDLPEVVADVKARVEAGEKPKEAVAAAVEAKRAEKEKRREEKQAEAAKNEAHRQQAASALPQAIKDREQATAEWRSRSRHADVDVDALLALVDELREANAALEADLATARAEIKKFEDMRVQYELGGFEKIIADKDVLIRDLQSRVYSESGEKVRNLNALRGATKKLEELGHTKNEVIDLDALERR